MNQVFDDVLISDGVSVVKGNKEASAGQGDTVSKRYDIFLLRLDNCGQI
ncbi:MAG: hypothetical protein PF495_01790 [Spirochaetales bacterium]|jgi:hypothetical protein|nr:hypothetical protein [Spirochaetales bacterium]